MITLQPSFEKNANSTGLQTFRQIKSGQRNRTKRDGTVITENVYIYQRITKEGKTFGYEVIVPSITLAGTVNKFPNGVTKTVENDMEDYPGASSFGRTGWFCINEENAEKQFNLVINETEKNENEPEQSSVSIPKSEFTTTEFAESNGLPYAKAFLEIKELVTNGTVRLLRKEQRGRGRATGIYEKV